MQTCVSALRELLRAVGPEVSIVTSAAGYGIRLPETELDVTVFRHLAGTGPSAAETGFRIAWIGNQVPAWLPIHADARGQAERPSCRAAGAWPAPATYHLHREAARRGGGGIHRISDHFSR